MAHDKRGGEVVDLTRESVADGDDIAVISDAPPERKPRRWLVIGTVVAGIAVVGLIAAFLALRDDGSSSAAPGRINSITSVPASTIPAGKASASAASAAKRGAAPKKGTTATTVPLGQHRTQRPRLAVGGNKPATPAQAGTRTTTPPTTAPKLSPLSALVWVAPEKISVPTGKTVRVAISARNPTAGFVTLPRPLSCTPRLQHDEVCAEAVQRVGPGVTATASYLIDATGVQPGVYELKLEGIRSMIVTVKA